VNIVTTAQNSTRLVYDYSNLYWFRDFLLPVNLLTRHHSHNILPLSFRLYMLYCMGFRCSVALCGKRFWSVCEDRTCNLWRLKTWRLQRFREYKPVNHYVNSKPKAGHIVYHTHWQLKNGYNNVLSMSKPTTKRCFRFVIITKCYTESLPLYCLSVTDTRLLRCRLYLTKLVFS